MTKKQKFNIQIVAVVSIAVIALLALNFWAIPAIQHKGSASSLTAQIVLTNGQVINLDSQTNSAKALAIISQTGSGNGISSTIGATISSINTNLYATPTFTGTIASYTFSGGYFSVYINTYTNGAMSTLIWSATPPFTPTSHPTLISGQSVLLCSSTASTNQVPFSYGQSTPFTSGQTYLLRDIVSGVSISGTFTDGSTFGPIMISNNAEIDWVFMYET